MDLSIIIVNWNSTEYLRKCLASLFGVTSGFSIEVVVIDNASSDTTCEEMISEHFPDVTFRRCSKNLGFAGGCNLGAEMSSGRILLFLNPDTEIRDDAISRLLRHLTVEPLVGAVGARLLNSDGSLQTSCIQACPTLWNQVLDAEFLRRRFPRSRLWGMAPLFSKVAQPVSVDAISGACFMVKREVFEAAGRFGPQYFMYVEDLDLSERIRDAGYEIHYMPDCCVVHHGGRSSSQQGSYFANLQQQESLLRYFRVTRGAWYSRCYRAALAAVAGIRVALLVLCYPLRWIGLQKRSPETSLIKWSSVFRWSLGLHA